MVNPQEAGGQTKTHRFWQTPSIDYGSMAAISQDVAQKLIDSMPGQIANIDSLHQIHVIVNKSIWHLWDLRL